MSRGVHRVLIFFVAAVVWPCAGEGSELPKDFPELRFTINPLFHSIGVKLGNALSVRRVRPVARTFEGELMLGFGTAPDLVTDRQCAQSILQRGTSTRRSNTREDPELRKRADEQCALFNNPWRFSFLSRRLFESVKEIKDVPVVIYFVNYFLAPSHLLMQTRNQALNVFPVQSDLQIEPSHSVPSWRGVHPEAGTITGRVVQASLEYPVRKTYEVIIQESQNANNFRAMSVNDGEMFRYITRAMLTGKLLRIEFVQLYRAHGRFKSWLLNYMTNFRIVSVSVVDDSQ